MKNKKKKRKRGFTLIELLAVIIILGILLVIAIPSVTKYITGSRKSSYISSAKSIISGVSKIANSEILGMTDQNTTYYIPAKYIKTENNNKSPYGEFTEAYVGVILNDKGYRYFWISNDTSKQGIKLVTEKDKLEEDLIEKDLIDEEIRETVESTCIDDKNRILILNLDGTWQEERIATQCVYDDGSTDLADTKKAIFLPGTDFILKIKKLAGDGNVVYSFADTNIKTIRRSLEEPNENNKQEQNVVSIPESEVPIYSWFDSGTIYWWSEDPKPNMNENAGSMFYNLQGLTDFSDLTKIKTDLTSNMRLLFGNCKSLESLNVSKFDTSKVQDMSGMFYIDFRWGSGSVLSNLKEIKGLENFNTKNVTNMSNMFHGQRKLKSLDLRSFDTSKVEYMYAMFGNCHELTNLNISSFDTSNVINLGAMFQHLTAIQKIDISNFNTSKVTNMVALFGCGATIEDCQLTEIKGLNKIDTSNVTNMDAMFTHQTKLRTLDLSNFDTRKVTDTDYMFYGTNLTTIYVSSLFDVSNVTESTNMFYKGTSNLVGISSSYVLTGGAGTTYTNSHKDKEYARIDDPANGRPGYFTLKTN